MEPISIILGLFIAGVGITAVQQKEQQQRKKEVIKAEEEVIKKKQQEQHQQLSSSNIKCLYCKQNIKVMY